jgi:hypothetical protein
MTGATPILNRVTSASQRLPELVGADQGNASTRLSLAGLFQAKGSQADTRLITSAYLQSPSQLRGGVIKLLALLRPNPSQSRGEVGRPKLSRKDEVYDGPS